MRVATWNVNSVRSRMPRLLPWLDERVPDVVCLQETKLPADAFDELVRPALTERGYAVAHHGDGRWNGVAIASRVGLDDVVAGLLDEPANPVGQLPGPEARAVSATCAGLRVISVYVPNGRTPEDPHYRYKLHWLAALRATVAAGDPAVTVVCGDMNVAPTDDDVYNAAAFATSTHVTPPERDALRALALHDVVRERWPAERIFTYWDYRAGMFHTDRGMRIDLILAGAAVAPRACAAWVDRHARKGTGPSDHAPVIVDFDDAPDGDCGPMVPPPSASRSSSRR
ncbi:MAG: exodeoxyribonuclease III [Pseudonocardiaceae bacterium]